MKIDIEKFDPCDDGSEWYNQQKSSIEAWQNCYRGDWMLWIAIELGVDKKKIILATAKCANTVRHLMKDERSTNAVDTFIAYGEGRATKKELKKARAAAADAASAADAADVAYEAADVAYEAADAAYMAASWDASRTAYWVSRATHYAADAAFHAAGESQEAMEANQLQTANICREILTDDIMKIIEKH